MHAFIVDDSPDVRNTLGDILREAGWTVTEADDGQTALFRLRLMAAPPDVAVVDWNMPEVSGQEFVQAVRSQVDYDGMRILMVATENGLARVIGALALGADGYLVKPFDREEVLTKLALMGLANACWKSHLPKQKSRTASKSLRGRR